MKSARSLRFAVPALLLALCGESGAAAAEAAAPAGPPALAYAATVTMTVCVLGSAYAVARIGSAAMGAAAEKPELLIRSLLFVALAEGLAVLGFVVSVMMLQRI